MMCQSPPGSEASDLVVKLVGRGFNRFQTNIQGQRPSRGPVRGHAARPAVRGAPHRLRAGRTCRQLCKEASV